MKECVFCNEKKINEYQLYETENFVVKIGYAIVSPGHVMIVSKKHYNCFADLPLELEKELAELKGRVSAAISSKFAEPFIIEYGVWGQSINHAHNHIIPSESPEYKIRSLLEEMVVPGGICVEEIDRTGLKEIYQFEKGYVTIEERGRLYVCHVTNIPNIIDPPHPFLSYRAFFTNKKGLNGIFSWKNMTEEDKKKDKEKRELTEKALIDII